ncbi:MAG: LCP family protein [Synergistaceae bacterium]|nr:LCP family protein [Synergistaceae bacterium]
MKKFIKVFIIILLALSAGTAGAFLRLLPFISPDSETIKESISFDDSSGTINILLVGLDYTDGSERADSLALAVIDIDSKKVKIMSIPRDSRVPIPKKGWDKINHAYSYGKIDLQKEVVVNLMGLPINYYIVLNFKTFPPIIDLLGGVEIDVEKKLVYNDYSGKLFINIPKGLQTLDGKTALEYVRFRHDPLGDIGRISRQQKFIKEVIRKLQSPYILPKLPELVAEITNMINTDMSPAQAIQLASYLKDMKAGDLNCFMMPGKAAYIGAISYWLPDIPKASMLLADQYDPETKDVVAATHEFIEDIPLLLSKITGKISILNGDGSNGLGKRASEELQHIGIDVGMTGNAKHFDYHTSSIMIPSKGGQEDMDAAEALAALCGINKKLISKNAAASAVTIILGKDKEKIFTNLQAARISE